MNDIYFVYIYRYIKKIKINGKHWMDPFNNEIIVVPKKKTTRLNSKSAQNRFSFKQMIDADQLHTEYIMWNGDTCGAFCYEYLITSILKKDKSGQKQNKI